MAYKQKQSSCAKMVDAKGKPSGLMMAGSAYHMEYSSPAKNTDPNSKDGVVVIGKDKSKSAKQARAERLAKKKEEEARKKEAARIEHANKIEERRFNLEEEKARRAAEKQRAQQKQKKKRGQIPEDAQDTSTNHMRGPLNLTDPDPKTGKKPATMDFNIGTGLVEGKGGRRKEFEKAFATAREAGVKEFTYNVGEEPKKKYTTKLRGK